MENSVKGILVTATIIGLFITCILNFIVLFPQEQGVTFTGEEQQGYLVMANHTDTTLTDLQNTNNQSENAFDQWDVTTGFMGTNQIKQGQGGIKTSITNTGNTLKIMATQLFGANSPIVYTILILLTLATGYLVYAVIKFVRTGL